MTIATKPPHLTLATAATSLPVTVADAKQHCRVDETEDDNYFEDFLIPAATEYCQRYTARQFINATWTLKLDAWVQPIILPKPPLSSVTSIQYEDVDDATQTLAATEYTVQTDIEPGRIVEAYQKTWPSLRGHVEDVTVTYVAGYGADSSSVPVPIRQAILLLCEHWYDNRGTVVIGTISKPLEKAVDSLLSLYKARGVYM